MSFSGLILTNSGRNELAKAEMGEKFCITDIVFGDGQYNGTRTDIKELVNPIMSLPVTKIERDTQNEGSVRVECDFNSADISKAFFWREIGIIANGKLCYYDNSREGAEYIDPESETIIKQKRMRFVLLISSDVEVNVTVGSALYALDEDMQRVLFPEYEGIAKLEELKSGEGIFKAFGKISKAISDLISHIGNKNNPHGVTKTQVGLGNVPNVASNDQTVTYTAATTLTALTSGEKLSVAFGKISKAISTLISHISIRATTSVLGHVKVTDSSAVTDSTGLALAATEKNAAIPGTLAYKIAEQNTNLVPSIIAFTQTDEMKNIFQINTWTILKTGNVLKLYLHVTAKMYCSDAWAICELKNLSRNISTTQFFEIRKHNSSVSMIGAFGSGNIISTLNGVNQGDVLICDTVLIL